MAIAVVQRGANGDPATVGNCSVAFGVNVTAANIIIVVGTIDGPINSLSTPTDTRGNTYVLQATIDSGLASKMKVWAAYNIIGGANTVTMDDGFSNANMFVFEVSGLAKFNAFDRYAFQEQSSVTALDSTNLTTQYANELLLGITANAANPGLAPTVGAGYSNLQTLTTAFEGGGSEERIVSAIGTYSAPFGIAANATNHTTAIFAFSETPIVAPATIHPLLVRLSRSGARNHVPPIRAFQQIPTPQAVVVAPLFLPTLGTNQVAILRGAQSSLLRPLSTKLRKPTVVAPAPNLFLPTGVKSMYAVRRSMETPLYAPRSTKLRKPVVVIQIIPNLFLPTLNPLKYAVVRSMFSSYLRPLSTRIRPPTVINPALIGPPFLPTLGVKLDKSRHSNNARTTKLLNQRYLTPPPFLPTLGVKLDKSVHSNRANSTNLQPAYYLTPPPFLPTIKVRLDRSIHFKYANSTKYLIAKYLTPPPFLPNLGVHLDKSKHINNANATKLRPPSVVTPAIQPSIFLPTLGNHLDRSVHSNRANATFLRPALYLVPPPFLPTLGVKLDKSIHTNRASSTNLQPAYYLVPPPFLPTLGVKLDKSVHTNRANSTKRLVARYLTPPPFLPTVKTILDRSIHSNRANATKRLQARYLTPPAFLPTLGRYLDRSVHPRPNKSLLRPPTVINPALPPPPFLPTGPKILYAGRRAVDDRLYQPRSTKLRKPTVTTAIAIASGLVVFIVETGRLEIKIAPASNNTILLTTGELAKKIANNVYMSLY